MNIRQLGKITTLAICNAIASLFGRPLQPAILMYHSFDTTEWKHGVDPKELERQLEYLVAKRKVVPLKDIVAWVKKEGEIPANAVAITIDDGYEDTYSVFFPLAKKYQLPFTLFLTTDLSVMPKLGNLQRPTTEQLKEMAESGLMRIGVHGHSHMNFPEVLERGLSKQEIEDSRVFIQTHFGQPADIVAYPAGRTNEAVFSYFKQNGYAAGCTTRQGLVQRSDDLMKLSRVVVDRATNFQLFSGRLKPGFRLFLTLRRALSRAILTNL